MRSDDNEHEETTADTASPSSPLVAHMPPQYEYKERLLVSPIVRNTSSSSSSVNWFLRFETHQQLITTTTSPSPSSPSSSFFFSPFPNDITALLQAHGAVRILIQVSNLASSSFPSSPLDTIPPLGHRDHHHVTHSPAGVLITVEFLQDYSENDSGKEDSSAVLDRFVRLLQEISAKRWVLASLASLQEPRLHRFIHQEGPVPYYNNNNDNNSTMVRISTILPTDGHALSAEAMVSFTTAFNPCCRRKNHYPEKAAEEAQAGLWSLVNPMAWSSLLLGNAASTNGVHGRRGRRRGFWIDISSSSLQQQQQQQYQVSQGLYYSRATTKAVAEGISLRELLSVDTTAPTSSWKSCPLADDTSLVVLAPDTSRINVSTSRACQKYQRPASTTIGDDTSVGAAIELDMASIDMTSKCLEVVAHDSSLSAAAEGTETTTTQTKPAFGQGLFHSTSSLPLWQVHLDLQRPAGVARHGTILTTVLNHDVDCSAHVSALQVIPPVISPIWHSLKFNVFSASAAMKARSSALASHASFPHPTVSWKTDGTIVLTFSGTLPADTGVQLELDYDPAFLPFEQFPADANRGFDLAPVQAHMRSLDCIDAAAAGVPLPPIPAATLYSHSVTLLAPLPDRSMPFNVLSLSCTLFAFILGSLINLLVRKSSERVKYTLYPDQKPKNKLKQVKEKIQRRFKFLVQRLVQKLPFRKTSDNGLQQDTGKEEEAAAARESTVTSVAGTNKDDPTKEKTE